MFRHRHIASWIATLVLAAACVASATAQAQVPAIDRYRVSARPVSTDTLLVTGLAGSVVPGAVAYVVNLRTYAITPPITPAADGSFTANIAGVVNDRLAVFAVDEQENMSPSTPIYAGALTIKNPYQWADNWRVGQAHTHTNKSDGANSPAALEAAYYMAGYDFVISTDHRGWPTPLFTDDDDGMTPDPDNSASMRDLLWVRGAELGNAQVHMGSWGTSSNVSLGDVTAIQSAIDATRALGGIAVINHPENADPPYSWDWFDEVVPVHDVSLIEAFNGGNGLPEGVPGNHTLDAIDLADEFQQVWWIGADDCHNVNNPLQFNQYAIVVQADTAAPSQADLLAAADSGRLYVRQTAQGPVISRVDVAGNVVQVVLADVASAYEVSWYSRGGELRERDLNVNTSATYVVQGSEGYVRAEVTRLSDGKKAYTQPLFIANAKDRTQSASSAALVDNASTTVWDAGAATGSFVVDTGAVRSLNAIRIDWDGADGRRFNYLVEVSDTGAFLGEQSQVIRRTYSNRLALTLDFFDARSRFVRVVITGQSAGAPATARVREVEVFDATPTRNQLYLDNVDGSDANTGRAGSPWQTLDFAREHVRPRDDLNFMQTAVPYPPMQLEARHSGKHAGATVGYRGANGVPARIEASGSAFGVTLSHVQWLEWTDFDISLATSANLLVTGGSPVISRNRLHHSQGNGVLGEGEFTLAYNLIFGNAGDGVLLYNFGTNAGIYNNVLYGNGGNGLAIQNEGVVNATIQNNVTAANGEAAFWRIANGTVVDTNNCGQGGYVGPWSQAGSIVADPRFNDAAGGDFTLQLTSPCIDAGIDLNYNADFDGKPIRDVFSVPNTGSQGAYSRTYVDMGAHEACDACNGYACHQ